MTKRECLPVMRCLPEKHIKPIGHAPRRHLRYKPVATIKVGNTKKNPRSQLYRYEIYRW